jgi:hypothetical protein
MVQEIGNLGPKLHLSSFVPDISDSTHGSANINRTFRQMPPLRYLRGFPHPGGKTPAKYSTKLLRGYNLQQIVPCSISLMRLSPQPARLISVTTGLHSLTTQQARSIQFIGAVDALELRTPQETLPMRSDLIFGALTHVNNRYKLCQLASKATRKLHKPNTRLQDTTNEVLDRFKDTIPMDIASEAEITTSFPAAERRAA